MILLFCYFSKSPKVCNKTIKPPPPHLEGFLFVCVWTPVSSVTWTLLSSSLVLALEVEPLHPAALGRSEESGGSHLDQQTPPYTRQADILQIFTIVDIS